MNEENLNLAEAAQESPETVATTPDQSPEPTPPEAEPAGETESTPETEEKAPAPDPLGLPPLGLWEMLEIERTENAEEADDEASRVLSGLRPSVWDARCD